MHSSIFFSEWVPTLHQTVFVNRLLRRIFGPDGDDARREWRRLHNKEHYALYPSPNIIRVIKSRRLWWTGHVARMGKSRGAYKVLMGKREGRNHLEEPGADRRIILKWVLGKWEGWTWTGSIWIRIGRSNGLLWMRGWIFGFYKMWGISLVA